jgi:hypothetical protein
LSRGSVYLAMSTNTQPDRPQEATGRPYDTPRLAVVGTVSELTLGPHDPQPTPPGGHVLTHSR